MALFKVFTYLQLLEVLFYPPPPRFTDEAQKGFLFLFFGQKQGAETGFKLQVSGSKPIFLQGLINLFLLLNTLYEVFFLK